MQPDLEPPASQDASTTDQKPTPDQEPSPDAGVGSDAVSSDVCVPFPYGADSRAVERGTELQWTSARGVLRGRAEGSADGAVGSTACPACGAETVDGAGLFTCLDCEWVGSLR